MKTKRILRWGIVLFLLAALPGLTVALAQGQEPPAKAPLPAVTERSESLTPVAANLNESEANNSMATADVMALNDVMAGGIGQSGDVDFFKFQVENVGGPDYAIASQEVLINIDAFSNGSSLDSVVTLYNAAGTVLGSNDDTDTVDSLYYYKLEPGWYYIKVQEFDDWIGGANYTYQLIVSRMILVSAAAANLGTGTVQGIPFQSGDILAQTQVGANNTIKWVMFFDISDLNLNKNVDKLSTVGLSPDILIGFQVNVTLPGTSIVAKPQDIVRFVPTRYGGSTAGTMYRYMIGANHQLTTTGEKLDAISDWTQGAGNLCLGHPVSTTGTANVLREGGLVFRPADEDIFCKEALNGFGAWKPFIDGSTVPGLAAEDIIAFDYNERMDTAYFVILGTGNIGGTAVNQKQILSLYMNPPRWRFVSWNGPAMGWNYNIDAIDVTGY